MTIKTTPERVAISSGFKGSLSEENIVTSRTPSPTVISKKFGTWHCMQQLVEHIDALGLLGDQYFYTAAGGQSLKLLKELGTYRVDQQQQPKKMVYCCEPRSYEGERTVQQVSRSPVQQEFDLYTYMNQNADDKGAIIIVWNKGCLEAADREVGAASEAAFTFRNPDNRRAAIHKIIRFTDIVL